MSSGLLEEGGYTIRVRCPACKGTEFITAVIHGRLTLDDGEEAGTIRLRVKAKAVEHQCNRRPLFDDRDLVDVELPGVRDEDARELAAGGRALD